MTPDDWAGRALRRDDNDGDRSGDEKALDRLTAFSDAVVAIAITLIVLPLVDRAMDAEDAAQFLSENALSFASAGVSFLIVAIFWFAHHRLFARATGYTVGVVRLEFCWLATIAFLPVATALEFVGDGPNSLAVTLYIAALLVASVAVRGQRLLLERAGMIPAADISFLDRWFGSLLLLVALALQIVLPAPGALWLLLLFIEPVVRRLFGRPAAP